MNSVSRKREYEQLRQEIETQAYQALLEGLQKEDIFLRRFGTWADVVSFMRKGTSRDPQKDEVLRPILRAHHKDEDPRWRTVLLVIFWPGLESLLIRKWGWDPDHEELWQNILWAFLQVVLKIDPTRRPDRLVQKLFNDTVHRLGDMYRAKWKTEHHEIGVEDYEFEALLGGGEEINLDAIELREVQEAEIQRLQDHLKAGHITESDFLLLVGTKVYGKSIASYAREQGLSYQMLRKRRHRAETAIKRVKGREK